MPERDATNRDPALVGSERHPADRSDQDDQPTASEGAAAQHDEGGFARLGVPDRDADGE
ncbi:MAG: hypothetical protein ACRDQB_10545 [Thermocrispum sp.]